MENKPILDLPRGQRANGQADPSGPIHRGEERWVVLETTEGLRLAKSGVRGDGGGLWWGEEWQGLTQESLERQTQTWSLYATLFNYPAFPGC